MIGCGDFSIEHDIWPGVGKLVEEMGEVGQVLGKIIGNAGADRYFDGTDLRQRLTEELGDLLAAIHFVIEENEIDHRAVSARQLAKSERFRAWRDGEEGGDGLPVS